MLYKKSVVSVDAFTFEDIQSVFFKAETIKKSYDRGIGSDTLKGLVLAALFYEPSSRTFSSFLTAMQKQGGGIIPLNSMLNTSVYKGETLEDTIRVFSEIGDIIVLRHPDTGAAKIAERVARIPVINAGDGSGEHPTQALLDSFTIRNHFSSLKEITVGLIGDLKYGRTVHSLSKLLARLGVKNFIFISPQQLKMPDEIKNRLIELKAVYTERENLTDVLGDLDIIYTTRVQKERFTDLSEYERLKLAYVITPDSMKMAKKKSILMHPLPRVGEVVPQLDSDPRSVYFREEIRNGLYIRSALLNLILIK